MPTVRSKHPCGRVGVQVEDDAERDHLALGARQGAEGLPKQGPYSSGSSKSAPRSGSATRSSRRRRRSSEAEVVERRSARQLTEPRLRAPSPRVGLPALERPLERLGGEVFGRGGIRGHVQEVAAVDVEVFLGGGGGLESSDRSRTRYTPPAPSLCTPMAHIRLIHCVPRVIGSSSASGGWDSALTRGRAIAGALLLIAALFLAGRFLSNAGSATEARPAAGAIAGDLRAEPRPRLVVHVVGAVGRPGLYRLADGARIADALRRAGGATGRADLSLVNLAAPVSDGSQVVVPKRAPPVSAGSGDGGGQPAPVAGRSTSTATAEAARCGAGDGPEDRRLPRTARRVQLDRRSRCDPGIGPARLEQLRELVAP